MFTQRPPLPPTSCRRRGTGHEQQIAKERRARSVKMLDALLQGMGCTSWGDVEVSTEEVAMARAYCAKRDLEATTGIAADWREKREKQLGLAKQRQKRLTMCRGCGLKVASFGLPVRPPPKARGPPHHRAAPRPAAARRAPGANP